jgi:electron transport complex protein RnfB
MPTLVNAQHQKWVPVVDEDLCTGCGVCVEACGPKSLEMQDRVAVLARPDTCGSEEHCIAPCPADAIHMAWVKMAGDLACGKWRAADAKTMPL